MISIPPPKPDLPPPSLDQTSIGCHKGKTHLTDAAITCASAAVDAPHMGQHANTMQISSSQFAEGNFICQAEII